MNCEIICGKKRVSFEKPKVMGILNLTPDSFHDGGKYSGEKASRRLFQMIDEGADFIDIGGESTRPGSLPVSAEEEKKRIVSFIREYSSSVSVPISVDTMKSEVAESALDAGADIINDMSGLTDRKMMELVSSSEVPAIVGHMNGVPETMRSNPLGDASAVKKFLFERKSVAEENGIKRLILDPGIGFGKTPSLDMEILSSCSEFSFGCPVLIGASYKSFLSFGFPDMTEKDASLEAAVMAIKSGANIVRVHDVKETVSAITSAIL